MRTWNTPEGLVFEDEQTGDGRLFVAGSITWEDQPDGWPLRYDPEDDGGHNGAVLVGGIGTLSRSGNAIQGTGTLDDDGDQGAEVARMLDEGAPLGVSADFDDMELEWVLADPEEPEDGEGDVILLAASLPTGRVYFDAAGSLAGIDAPGLRGLMASAGLVAAAGEGEPEDGIVMFTEAMDDIILRFTRARFRGATLVDIPAFANARIVLDASEAADDEAGTDTAGDDQLAASGAHSGDSEPCVPCLARTDALVAASAPVRPPRAWFDNPGLRELTPLTFTDDGRVFGHIAGWSTCHTGSPDGECILTPRSATGYAYFHTGPGIILDDGSALPVGSLTLGGGHADRMLSYRGALAHYDDVSAVVADVRAGEDAYGVWVAGGLRPDVAADELRMRQLRGADPSGDWRWIAGSLELILAHSVNGPGFPVPNAMVAASGQIVSLVAAGARDVALARRRRQGGTGQATADVIADAVERGIAGYMARMEQAARSEQAARLRRLDPARVAAAARLRG